MRSTVSLIVAAGIDPAHGAGLGNPPFNLAHALPRVSGQSKQEIIRRKFICMVEIARGGAPAWSRLFIPWSVEGMRRVQYNTQSFQFLGKVRDEGHRVTLSCGWSSILGIGFIGSATKVGHWYWKFWTGRPAFKGSWAQLHLKGT